MTDHDQAPATPDIVCVGGIIIDDIVFADGTTRMAVIGGGGAHAATGVRIWGSRPGLSAVAGEDLPDTVHDRLARDFDLQGIQWTEAPQPRAWQLFEWDGHRTELPRVPNWQWYLDHPLPDDLPASYQAAQGMYVLRDAVPLAEWRASYPDTTLLWEPIQKFMIRDNADAFRAALPDANIVSPNLDEAQQIYGFSNPVVLVWAMLDDGAEIVALRMGDAGSVVGHRDETELISVPAVPVPAVTDQTGAGNTYCGGFLTGWLETGDLLQAACYATVAASFALETLGIADLPRDLAEVRAMRLAWLHDQVIQPNEG